MRRCDTGRSGEVALAVCFILTILLFGVSVETLEATRTPPQQPLHGEITCPVNDDICERDKLGFDAIKTLHQKIDDDKDGKVDLSESDEYIRDEMKFDVDGSERHKSFHGNDDMISVEELWKLWIQSEVYNWTVEETTDWLVNHVELPQYADKFKVNVVDGRTLPRLAANNHHYMSSILGIKNPINKQKLSFKATDVVLFGAPKKGHNYIKDLALVASMVIAVGGCWLAYVQNRYSQSHLKKVMKDLDNLQKAEDALTNLQNKLEEAQQEQQSTKQEKQNLENTMAKEIDQAKSEAERLRKMRETTEEEMSSLRLAEEELKQVRMVLAQAERELQERPTAPLMELQQWLQLTYELETRHYDVKREAAERQLLIAKEMCEKIRKKRAAFLGSLRIAHSTSIDDTDQKILNARSAMEDVKLDLQERSQRWQQIEKICGFSIIQNPGLAYLESMLRVSGHSLGSNLLCSRQLGGSTSVAPFSDELDDDMSTGYHGATAIHSSGLPSELRDRRVPTLAAAFSGSSASLQPAMLSSMTQSLSSNNMLLTTPVERLARPLSARCMRAAAAATTDVMTTEVSPDSSIGRLRARQDSNPLLLQDSDSVSSQGRTRNSNPNLLSQDAASVASADLTVAMDTSVDHDSGDSGDSLGHISASGHSVSTAVTDGAVKFQLGEMESDVRTDHQTESSPPISSQQSQPTDVPVFQKSTSLDPNLTRAIPRPNTLPKALSDGHMKPPVLLNNNNAANTSSASLVKGIAPGLSKRTSHTKISTPVTDVQEENSSPESTDSLSLNGEKKDKKKKRKNFLKLLKRDSEKNKTS